MTRTAKTMVVTSRRRKPAHTAYCLTCNWIQSFTTRQAADKAAQEHKHS